MAISYFSKMAAAAILDLFEPEIAPLNPPSRKPHARTRYEVDSLDWTTGCGDIAA